MPVPFTCPSCRRSFLVPADCELSCPACHRLQSAPTDVVADLTRLRRRLAREVRQGRAVLEAARRSGARPRRPVRRAALRLGAVLALGLGGVVVSAAVAICCDDPVVGALAGVGVVASACGAVRLGALRRLVQTGRARRHVGQG